MSASQRTKGQAGEREAATLLTGALGRIVKRNLGQERDGGSDITIGTTCGALEVQVKRQEQIKLYPWLEQAQEDAGDKLAAVMLRTSRRPWVIAMEFADFCCLLREVADYDGLFDEPRVDLPEK